MLHPEQWRRRRLLECSTNVAAPGSCNVQSCACYYNNSCFIEWYLANGGCFECNFTNNVESVSSDCQAAVASAFNSLPCACNGTCHP